MAERTRGELLTLTTVGLGAVIGGVIGVPAAAYVLAPVTKEVTFAPVFLGKTSVFTGETALQAHRRPRTSRIPTTRPRARGSRTSTTRRRRTPTGTPRTPCSWSSRTAACTWAARSRPPSQGFACPCHGGQYNQNGERIAGPPIRSLDRFQWEIKNSDELWITQRWSTDIYNNQVHYYPVKTPGQPTHTPGPSWIANLLYYPVTYTHGPVPGPVTLPPLPSSS